jgi:hypothetical protein
MHEILYKIWSVQNTVLFFKLNAGSLVPFLNTTMPEIIENNTYKLIPYLTTNLVTPL